MIQAREDWRQTMRSIRAAFCWLSPVFFAILLVSGCSTTQSAILPPALQGEEIPAEILPLAQKLEAEGPANWVLNLNEIAMASLQIGRRDIAKAALDESILHINDVFGTTPEAVKARSLFFAEKSKLFKGDPYERSMTFYYRGVLYMQDRDWANARACFRSAVLQDAFAEESQFKADWTLFDYLIGVCEIQLGRDFQAREAYELALKTYRAFPAAYASVARIRIDDVATTPPLLGRQDNLLVLTSMGQAPRKVQVGDYRQFLTYERTTKGNPEASLIVCGNPPQTAHTIDSVYYQAATRGGRPFDRIQGKKVVFKSGSKALGEGAMVGGTLLLLNSDNEGAAFAGAAVLAGGLVVRLFSNLVKTEADTRQWSTVPDSLGMYFGEVCSGSQPLTVRMPSEREFATTVNLPPPGQGLAVVLVLGGKDPAIIPPPQ